MKALSSVIGLGIGLLMVSGSPADAQLGGMGDAMKKGAADAAKQEMMKGAAEKAGLAVPGTATAAPAAETPAAGTPGAADTPAAGTPGAVDTPAGKLGAAGAAQDAAGALEKKMPKLP
jgi:hypothetical protein